MKKVTSKIITFVLAAAMTVTALPAGVLADEVYSAPETLSEQPAENTDGDASASEASEESTEITSASSEGTEAPKTEEVTEAGQDDPSGAADDASNEIQTYANTEEYSVQNVRISGVDQSTGSFSVTISGVSAPDGFDHITVPVWSKADQSDINWYTAQKTDEDTYVVNGNIANHSYNTGTYNVHSYIVDKSESLHFVNSSEMSASTDASQVIAGDSGDTNRSCAVSVSGQTLFGRKFDVVFPVWSESNGQDDIVWYTASGASGTYTANISLASHRGTGTYNVHAYARLDNGILIFLGQTTFEVASAGVSSVTVSEVNTDTGVFTVTISGVTAPSGLKSITVPVWSKADQSDIHWYKAAKNNNGDYVVSGNLANHKYNTGTYNVHTYVENSRGDLEFVNASTMSAAIAPSQITVGNTSASHRSCSISFGAQKLFGRSFDIQFAVWSDANGQDDIIWYTAKKSSGSYTADISIASHRGTGTYNAHCYARLDNGALVYLGETKFDVPSASASSVSVSGIDKGSGTFTVTISGVEAPLGVKKITVPVWSKADQSDIHWYTASKQSDGSYTVKCSLANHSYNMGTYNVHAYVENNSGTLEFIGSTTAEAKFGYDSYTVTDVNKNEKQFRIDLKGLGTYGRPYTVQFVVWSEAGGQDDIKWYNAVKNGSNYSYTVNVADHASTGKYNAHCYLKDASGKLTYLTELTFDVTKAQAGTVEFKADKTTGNLSINVSNISSASGVSRVEAMIWTKSDKSDVETVALKASGSSYVFEKNISAYDYKTGTYSAQITLIDGNGIKTDFGTYTADMNINGGKITAKQKSEIYYDVSLSGFELCNAVSSVRFAVWSISGGQDDITWYNASLSNGTYSATVDLTNHMSSGAHALHAYATLKNGSTYFLTGTEFSVASVPKSTVEIQNVNKSAGTFDVRIVPAVKSSTYKGISVPVWSEAGGQDDIIWYNAVKQSDGSYKVSVKLADHGYGMGVYNVHAYASKADGSLEFLAKTTYTAEPENLVGMSKLSDSYVKITVYGASCNGKKADSVEFYVWSDTNGQDDLVKYSGVNNGDGSFSAEISRGDFDSDGTYTTHIYTYAGSDSQVFGAPQYSLYYPIDYDSYAASVMRNIIYAVETGGQIYGNARYNDFTPAYTNSRTEKAITIGAGCWYATEAQRLLKLIRQADPDTFARLDTAGIGEDLDNANWSTYGSDGTTIPNDQPLSAGQSHRTIEKGSDKAVAIQNIINTDVGRSIQNQLVDEQMAQYVQEAAKLGVTDLKARMFCANLRHLGGSGGMSRVIKNCINDGLELTMDNLWATMLKHDDQSSTGNEVGSPIYHTRHQRVMSWLNTYIG
jgi:hypothetical protein